jgi:hypothetical protein
MKQDVKSTIDEVFKKNSAENEIRHEKYN